LGFELQAVFQNASVSLMWDEKVIEGAVFCIMAQI
jgi:hypothetical protein